MQPAVVLAPGRLIGAFVRRLRFSTLLVAVAAAVAGLPAVPAHAAVPADLTTLVNPMIGTQKEGNTFPGAALPFGMVQVSPDTGHGTGYNYDHGKVWGFSNTHLSGVGCPVRARCR